MTNEDIIRMAHEAGLHIATDHDWMPIIALAYAKKLVEVARADEREACKELMLKAMRVLEEAQTYTSCQAWSPSMTEECKQMEEALRNYMYDKLAEKHADNMKKDIKVMTDWVKKETEAIRARGQHD